MPEKKLNIHIRKGKTKHNNRARDIYYDDRFNERYSVDYQSSETHIIITGIKKGGNRK